MIYVCLSKLEKQVSNGEEEAALDAALIVGDHAEWPLLCKGNRVGVVIVHQPD